MSIIGLICTRFLQNQCPSIRRGRGITADWIDYKVKAEDLKHIFRADFQGVKIFIKSLAAQMGKKC
jgi:hypothetical protein